MRPATGRKCWMQMFCSSCQSTKQDKYEREQLLYGRQDHDNVQTGELLGLQHYWKSQHAIISASY